MARKLTIFEQWGILKDLFDRRITLELSRGGEWRVATVDVGILTKTGPRDFHMPFCRDWTEAIGYAFIVLLANPTSTDLGVTWSTAKIEGGKMVLVPYNFAQTEKSEPTTYPPSVEGGGK